MSKQTVSFDYFHGCESEQFAFYRISKVLFTNDYFKGLSSDAKVLYGLMLDRMALSVKNHWIDDKDRVYIIFTLEQVMEYMNCGKDKGVKILAELDIEKGIGLIERVKRGLGKPAIIYVKSFLIKENPVCNQAESRSPEVGKAEVKISEKLKPGVLENRSADFGKSDIIKTDYNNTDLSETDPINLSGGEAERKRRRAADGTGGMDQMDMIRAYLLACLFNAPSTINSYYRVEVNHDMYGGIP